MDAEYPISKQDLRQVRTCPHGFFDCSMCIKCSTWSNQCNAASKNAEVKTLDRFDEGFAKLKNELHNLSVHIKCLEQSQITIFERLDAMEANLEFLRKRLNDNDKNW